MTFTDQQREEIACVLEIVAKDGLPGPRDLDVALDAIECTVIDPTELMSRSACFGCGSVESLEEIRKHHPKAVSCCPEREMLTAHQWSERYDSLMTRFADLQQACLKST